MSEPITCCVCGRRITEDMPLNFFGYAQERGDGDLVRERDMTKRYWCPEHTLKASTFITARRS